MVPPVHMVVRILRAEDNCLQATKYLLELVASRDSHMYVAGVWHFHQDGTVEHCRP